MICKDCIHERVCYALIKEGLPYLDEKLPAEAFCMTFKNKSEIHDAKVCKWVNEDFPDRPATQLTMAICSACGGYAHRTGHGYSILSKYCPYCGARMEYVRNE